MCIFSFISFINTKHRSDRLSSAFHFDLVLFCAFFLKLHFLNFFCLFGIVISFWNEFVKQFAVQATAPFAHALFADTQSDRQSFQKQSFTNKIKKKIFNHNLNHWSKMGCINSRTRAAEQQPGERIYSW